jgi:hypothetical protein
MQPDLPTGYYLDNVLTLFEQVESLYRDIMPVADLGFLLAFADLSTDAQRLYIRLLNRSLVLFRLSKLNYVEIASIPSAMLELAASGFLQIDPELETGELIGLFTRPELLSIHPQPALMQKYKRSEMDVLLLQAEPDFFQQLMTSDQILQVLRKESYLLCQMLFFGNLNQSMTDFVLRDLGLNRFENYDISAQNRPYRSELDIKQHWLLYRLNSVLDVVDPTDIDSLTTCFEAVPTDVDNASALFRRCERIKYHIARQLERLGQYALAMDYYRQCRLPPSRERMARVLNQQGDVDSALLLCEQMIGQPLAEEETQFAAEFSARLAKRNHRKLSFGAIDSASPLKPNNIELMLDKQSSVELAVTQYYLDLDAGNVCFYVENNLFSGVLGMLIWEVIFLPVEGAFYNSFQHRPADFYDHDFLQKRQHEFNRVWSSLSNNADIHKRIVKIWHSKQGLMNPLVNWSNLDLTLVELALQRIEFSHWMAIFQRLLKDLRNNRSGFPDLILFPAQGGYTLIEVKGPGDTLQKNQKRWMTYFAQQDIPHHIAQVRWKLN